MPATKADKMLTIGMRQSFAHHTLEWMNICKLEDIVGCDRVRRDDLLRSITQTEGHRRIRIVGHINDFGGWT